MANKSFSKEFITMLLEKANITNTDGKVDKDYVERLAEQLDKKLGIFVMSKLSNEDLEEYSKMIAKKETAKKLGEFIHNKIPNYAEEQKKFLDDYAYNFFNRAAKMKQALNK